MVPNLKPYPAYKPSGVEWLGDVPEHWEVRRVKSLSLVRRGASPRPIADPKYFENDGEFAWVRIADVTASDHYLEKTRQRLSQLGQSLSVRIQPGALFLSIAGSIGKPIISKIKCCIHDGFVYFPQFRGNVEFLYRVFSCKAPFARLGKLGTQVNLNTDTVGNICLGWPPLHEQTAIVRFLDHADRRIRRYIRAKRKLIALLEEEKQAIIHQAITGRIDVRSGQPYPAYKPSGVEWLGEVPEHWEVKRLKWVTRLQRGYDLPSDQRVSGPYPVVSSGGVIDMHSEARSDGPGVVMGRYGSTDAVFFIEPDFWPHNTALFVTNFQGNRPRWCYYMLRAISKADHAGKSAVPGVDRKDLFEIKVAVPHIEVQDTIIEKLEEILIRLEAAFARTRSQIDLFREYQTRLIADVVTGKIDVRGAAAALPEVDPLETEEGLDDAIDADAEEAAHELAAVLEEAEA